MRELVDTFLTEAPSMLADLRESLADGEAERFRRAAHSLKSNANTFGALTLGALAKDLELSGRQGSEATRPERARRGRGGVHARRRRPCGASR